MSEDSDNAAAPPVRSAKADGKASAPKSSALNRCSSWLSHQAERLHYRKYNRSAQEAFDKSDAKWATQDIWTQLEPRFATFCIGVHPETRDIRVFSSCIESNNKWFTSVQTLDRKTQQTLYDLMTDSNSALRTAASKGDEKAIKQQVATLEATERVGDNHFLYISPGSVRDMDALKPYCHIPVVVSTWDRETTRPEEGSEIKPSQAILWPAQS